MFKLKSLSLSICCIASLYASQAQAADYPEHAISMVVPYSAGGPTDTVARPLAEGMRKSLGQSVVVENKAGAGGTIGSNLVANAKPDGYTVLLMHVGFTTAPSLYKKLNYDPIKSFEPIGMVLDVPMTIVARSDFPPNNVEELVKYLKENQSKVVLANAGIGAASQLCGTMLQQTFGVKLLEVPYKGAGPAMNDLLGKQVDLLCDQTTNTIAQIKSNKIKAYAITSKQRSKMLPDLPTMAEKGYKDFDIGIWHGLWAPANTPKPVIAKLEKALQSALAEPSFEERMHQMGATLLNKEANPQALTDKVKQQVPFWKEVFEKAGLQPQ